MNPSQSTVTSCRGARALTKEAVSCTQRPMVRQEASPWHWGSLATLQPMMVGSSLRQVSGRAAN